MGRDSQTHDFMFNRILKHQSSQGRVSESKANSILGSWKFVSGLLIVLLAYLWCASDRGITLYDEGLVCVGAQTVLRGGLLYRDFWAPYGPGQYYLLAGMFRVFGTTLLVAREYTVIAEWTVCIFTYLIARKLSGSMGALASCITVAIWLNCDRLVLYPLVPALAFTLAGFLVFSFRPPTSTRSFVAGMLLGCAILVRHDLGVYAAASLTVIVAGEQLSGDFSSAEKGSSRFALAAKAIHSAFDRHLRCGLTSTSCFPLGYASRPCSMKHLSTFHFESILNIDLHLSRWNLLASQVQAALGIACLSLFRQWLHPLIILLPLFVHSA